MASALSKHKTHTQTHPPLDFRTRCTALLQLLQIQMLQHIRHTLTFISCVKKCFVLFFSTSTSFRRINNKEAKQESVMVMYRRHELVQHWTSAAAIFGGTWEGWPATPLPHWSVTGGAPQSPLHNCAGSAADWLWLTPASRMDGTEWWTQNNVNTHCSSDRKHKSDYIYYEQIITEVTNLFVHSGFRNLSALMSLFSLLIIEAP